MAYSVKAGPANTTAESDGNTIRVVSARTGLGMETLRAWERRYGFPRPERRPGSNRRLYSASDIERLVEIQRALERGYRIGDVVGKTMCQLGELTPVAKPGSPPLAAPAQVVAVADLIELLTADRLDELEAQLRRGALGLGPRRFVTELAHPFAVSVGLGWASGRLSVRHEHVATECLITQIRLMLAGYQDLDSPPRVLLSTLPGEPHTLPLQMVALYLVSQGAKPRLLGASTPPREIAEAARRLEADVVGLTVTGTCDRKQTKRDVATLRKLLPESVALWVGGGGAVALGMNQHAHSVHIVTSWDDTDAAIAAQRNAARPRRRSA